ncbi:type II secretion system F family protein [Tichowtungia aerotolerans]|uniref:Type II secretion system F family protein n=1 Tax=Tichowtungia aerotolerans TaxID=2697043 RepID=A0A6P1M8B6_9BACT|nr:type II secretion system F family protein [Tichowtungia aerotolerans]QHI70840.1 type II secretion system F family protein [Tichowtungia aerotolerans]
MAEKAKKKIKGARKIRLKELPIYTRQLSAMLSSGMPLVQSINALEEQTEDKNFKEVLKTVRMDVEGGAMYSDALGSYPQVFDNLYVNMMRAGETGGMLAETADRVAGFLEASNRLRAKVKSAMMYPSVVMTVALIICTCLIIWVVPVFAGMFGGFGAELPAPTQALMNVSDFIKSYWYIVISVIAAAIYSLRRYAQTDRGEYVLDGFKLRFPMIGVLARKIAITRFASTFSQLMSSGVPIIQAMTIVGVATGNRVIGQAILDARSNVEQGSTISSTLESNKEFPKMLIHMLSAGEKTGKMEEMLSKLSDFYQEEVDTMLEGLTSMLEPLLMVVIGIMIGGIVLCMFLPIFKMSELVM